MSKSHGSKLASHPALGGSFVNAERTRAAVKVTVGYAGATVPLRKENGIWVALELTNQWVT